MLIPATEPDSSAQSVEAKHEVGVSARQVAGVGSSLLEAYLHGYNVIGFDSVSAVSGK